MKNASSTFKSAVYSLDDLRIGLGDHSRTRRGESDSDSECADRCAHSCRLGRKVVQTRGGQYFINPLRFADLDVLIYS